jgi:hypothetical protein
VTTSEYHCHASKPPRRCIIETYFWSSGTVATTTRIRWPLALSIQCVIDSVPTAGVIYMISRQHHIALQNGIYYALFKIFSTYDHRTLKTRLPVRSALFKQRTGGLVVRWVTTSEYPLLYVFVFVFGSSLVEVWPLFFRDAGRTRGEEGKLV